MNIKDAGKKNTLCNMLKACFLFAVCTSVFASPIYTNDDGLTDAQIELKKELERINEYDAKNNEDDIIIVPMGGCTPTPGCVGNAVHQY